MHDARTRIPTLQSCLASCVWGQLGSDRAVIQLNDNEPAPNFSFSNTFIELNEDAGTQTIEVQVSPADHDGLTVDYVFDTDVAFSAFEKPIPGEDFNASDGTLTFAPGAATASIDLEIIDDSVFEAQNEQLGISLENASRGFASADAFITITDNDTAVGEASLADTTVTVDETAGTAQLTVELNQALSNDVQVIYETFADTAKPSLDYIGQAAALTIPANTTSATFDVTILDDSRSEPTERFFVNLRPLEGVAVAGPSALVNITDDETPDVPLLQSISGSAEESSTPLAVELCLDQVPGSPAPELKLATFDISANAGSDYTSISDLTVTFAAQCETVDITLLDNDIEEPNEFIGLALSEPQNLFIDNPSGEAQIIDDDGPTVAFASNNPTEGTEGDTLAIDVVLDPPASETVTVNYSLFESGATFSDFTDQTTNAGTLEFATGTTTQTISIELVDDTTPESVEAFQVFLNSVTGARQGTPNVQSITILDNDVSNPEVAFTSAVANVNENAGSVTLDLALNTTAHSGVSVDVLLQDGSADSADYDRSGSPITVNFAAGQNTATVDIAITDDGADEGAETFTATLTNSSGATIGTPDVATVTIQDDDGAALPIVAFNTATANVNEDAGQVTLDLALNTTAHSGVSVDVLLQDGSADSADYDRSGSPITVNFAAGQDTATVDITITDDTSVEGAETFTATLTNPSGATIGTPDVATVTITDNDSAVVPDVAFTSATANVNEDAGQVTLDLALNTTAHSGVSIDVLLQDGSADSADYDRSGSPITVNFAAGQDTATVDIAIIDDTSIENNETFTATLTNPSGATIGTPDMVSVNILDDDSLVLPDISFTDSFYTVSEGVPLAVIGVELSAPALQGVTVSYATVDGSAQAGSDYTAISGTVTLPAGAAAATFTVPVVDDTEAESSETVRLVLSNPAGAALGEPMQAILTITDDDNNNTVPPVTETITAEDGGTVTSGDGTVTISFPAGAFNGDVLATLQVQNEPVRSLEPGQSSLVSFTLVIFDKDGNPVTEFEQPVTITMAFAPGNRVAHQTTNTSADNLVVRYWDGSAYVEVGPTTDCPTCGYTIDANTGSAAVTFDRPAEFVLVNDPSGPAQDTDSTLYLPLVTQ